MPESTEEEDSLNAELNFSDDDEAATGVPRRSIEGLAARMCQ